MTMEIEKNSRKKTIFFISHASSRGGAQLALFQNIQHIDKSLYTPIVLLPHKGPLTDMLEQENIQYYCIPLFVYHRHSLRKTYISPLIAIKLAFSFMANALALSKAIAEYRPSLIFLNSSTLLGCGIIARLLKIPLVWEVREVLNTDPIGIKIRKMIATYATKIIVDSNYSKISLSVGKENENIVVMQNFVDTERFYPINKCEKIIAKFDIKEADYVFGISGQIMPTKGHLTLIKALFIAVQRFSNIKLVIIGSETLMKSKAIKESKLKPGRSFETMIRTIINELHLENYVIFGGEIDNIPEAMSVLDCLIFPSTVPESFGRAITEAMACAKPVIATNIGGQAEIVENNITGILVAPNEPQALAEAMIDLLSDTKKGIRMGQAGYKKIKEKYDLQKNRGVFNEFLNSFFHDHALSKKAQV